MADAEPAATSEQPDAPSPEAHEPPPAPENRSITPAPEDFESPPPPQNLLWPVLWCAIAAVLIAALHQAVSSSGWPVPKDDTKQEAEAAQ